MKNSRVSICAVALLVLAVAGPARAQSRSILGANVAIYVTATMDGYYAWYEQGFNPDAPTSGLPHPGITAAVTGSTGTQGPSGTFLMQDYTQNNALLLNGQHASGTLTFATPTPADAFWLTTATGFGPAYLDTITHFADGTPDFTQNFLFQDDWFHVRPDVYNTGGRVDINPYFQPGGLNSHPGDFEAAGLLRVAIQTVIFPDAPPHPVSSIDIGWEFGRTDPQYPCNTAIFGVSVSTNGAAGPFNAVQLTPSSFNQDVVVEASALSSVPEPGLSAWVLGALMMIRRRGTKRSRAKRSQIENLEARTLLSTTWTVTSTADDGSTGTLRQIIGASASGDTVNFDSTVFSANVGNVITLNGTPLEIGHDLTIQGPGASVLSVSGNNVTRGLIVDPGSHATISGATITQCNNTVDTSGGAIYVEQGATLSLDQITFSGNTGNLGGAIYNQGTSTISGCTFTGNTASNTVENFGFVQGGGAIENTGTLNVSDSTFSNNVAIAGGAVDNYGDFRSGGSAQLTNCTFQANNAKGRYAGGGAVSSGGTLLITGCTFTSNADIHLFAAIGGAVSVYNANATIDSSRFSGNSAKAGGAMYVQGNATVSDTTFDSNTGSTGGAINVSSGTLNLLRCTVSNNSATAGSGGGVGSGGIVRLIDSTIANNSATADGGGVYSFATLSSTNSTISGNIAYTGGGIFSQSGSTATLNNTIVARNQTTDSPFPPVARYADIDGTGVTGSFNLIGAGGSGGLVNSVNYNMVGVPDPGLSALGNHGRPTQTFALLAGSLAINTGRMALAVDQNGQPLTTDQRGEPRVGASSVDVGSYEAQVPGAAPTNLSAVGGVDTVTLTWTRSSDTSVSIFRGTSPGGEDATPIATMVGTDSYVDSTLAGVTYYYKVAVANALGQSPFSNETSAAASLMAPLVSPDGTSGFNLVRDADQQHIDWTSGTASGQFYADDPNVVIVGNASNTVITTDYSRGGVLPRYLRLSGNTFTIQTTSPKFLADQGNTIDVGASTVYFIYDPSQGNPSSDVEYALEHGYANGNWNGAPPPDGTSIVSSAVTAAGPVGKYSLGCTLSVDGVVPDQPDNSVEVRFTLAGDANLDGKVDMADALRLQSVYGNYASGGWEWGNFDYNTTFDSNDAILMARNYGQSLPAQTQGSTVQPVDLGTTTTTGTPVATVGSGSGGSGTSGSGTSKPVTTIDEEHGRGSKHKKPHRQ
jgi:predicted outer membrane repeat protein